MGRIAESGKGDEPVVAEEPWKRTNTTRLVIWSLVWGVGVVVLGVTVLHASAFFLIRRPRASSSSS